MTSFQIRTSPDQADAGADHVLDWFPGSKARSTVAYEPDFLKNAVPSDVALDFLRIGGAVFCADKVALRRDTDDGWTRDLALSIPLSDIDLWQATAAHLERTLGFLSGDRWTLTFTELGDEPAQPLSGEQATLPDVDAVCLFSGGLDSLAGAVDLLHAGKRVLLVGHHDSPKADHHQKLLKAKLDAAYPQQLVEQRRMWLRPNAAHPAQARSLPEGDDLVESTTRSRSFLFLAAAVAIADAAGPTVPVVMPENGFIGINVPLTPSRSGSLSTRTTHPLYVAHMRALLDSVGLRYEIENPFRLMTKGEILRDSPNTQLLWSLANDSISCSRPETGRWQKGSTAADQGNCGACFPCLIRRASMHVVGLDRRADYLYDAFADPRLAYPNLTGASLRALLDSLHRPEKPSDVLINGRIPNGEAKAFFEVYSRGRDELRAWLSSGAHPLLP
ncbi:MAG TPA: Qat anti-phage system QueC-like protein QatC [Baekduia sp.]|uniref:Qat anti-phage system QueC-like protein QatC n=1 Tax=Baekduia sp. TaxID=2600305 RepID=UPI002CB40F99|nr:Qat anti-phage system QueC-like protein QatC [Baekduia sp.]HMJ35414.1 Qat anti-phage system QueC-like protein QatC [Baekduia sp.]